MAKWEYQILVASEQPGGMDKLNAAGREGWEAVSAVSGGSKMTVLLKRPTAPEDGPQMLGYLHLDGEKGGTREA